MKTLGILLGSVAIATGQALSGVSGTVVNAVDGMPLAGVKVSVISGNSSTVTDPTGRFLFSGLKPGVVYLTAQKEGFANSSRTAEPAFPIAPGEITSGVSIQLEPEATISGRVVNDRGEPVSASVSLLVADTDYFAASISSTSGEFHFRGLIAGEYHLFAHTLGPEKDRFSVTYYPNQTLRNKAGTIRLLAAEQRSNTDVVLQNAREATIKGTFAGQIPPGSQYSVFHEPRAGRAISAIDSAPLDEKGQFSLKLRAGEYRLTVMNYSQGAGQRLILGFFDLTVNHDDLDDVVIPASPIRTVRAKLRWAVDRGRDLPTADLVLNPQDGLGTMQIGKPRDDGWIEAPDVSPGIYTVNPRKLPQGSYARSIRAGGADITQTGLNLVTGTATDLEIELAEDGGQVIGQILDTTGQPVRGGLVVIFFSFSGTLHRAEQELWTRYASGDARGQFNQTDLAPGEYTVTAWTQGKQSPAQTLRVAPNSVTRLQLVIP